MASRNRVKGFIASVLVMVVAAVFALTVDVFINNLDQSNSQGFVKMVTSASYEKRKIEDLKARHEHYLSEGIGAEYLYQRHVPTQRNRDLFPEPRQYVRSEPDDVTGRPQSVPARSNPPEVLAYRPKHEANWGAVPIDRDETNGDVIASDDAVSEQEVARVASVEPAAGVEGDVHEHVPEHNQEGVSDKIKALAKPLYDKGGDPHSPKVVVIIDDMGVSAANSTKVEHLPGPLTLSYLPYAKNLPERTKEAAARGHELMVHMPMQPLNDHIDPGPKVLKGDESPEQFDAILEWGLSQFSGYKGVNNHMGSRLTQNSDAMRRVMEKLAPRGLYFIDSKTIGASVAADMAAQAGMAYAERDVFLDHVISDEYIEASLKKLERIAREKGYAIAIGHPHPETIKALTAWLPTLREKGLTLVPASAVVHHDKRYYHVAADRH